MMLFWRNDDVICQLNYVTMLALLFSYYSLKFYFSDSFSVVGRGCSLHEHALKNPRLNRGKINSQIVV